jgi:hypothetical protein
MSLAALLFEGEVMAAKTAADGFTESCRELGIDLLHYLAHPREKIKSGDAEVANSLA